MVEFSRYDHFNSSVPKYIGHNTAGVPEWEVENGARFIAGLRRAEGVVAIGGQGGQAGAGIVADLGELVVEVVFVCEVVVGGVVVAVVVGEVAAVVVEDALVDAVSGDLGVFVDQITGISVGGGNSIHDGIPLIQVILLKPLKFPKYAFMIAGRGGGVKGKDRGISTQRHGGHGEDK